MKKYIIYIIFIILLSNLSYAIFEGLNVYDNVNETQGLNNFYYEYVADDGGIAGGDLTDLVWYGGSFGAYSPDNWWHKSDETQEEYIIRIADVIRGHYNEIYNNNILNDVNYYHIEFKEMASNPKPIVSGLLDYLELPQHNYDWSVLDTVYYHKALNRWESQPILEQILGDYS